MGWGRGGCNRPIRSNERHYHTIKKLLGKLQLLVNNGYWTFLLVSTYSQTAESEIKKFSYAGIKWVKPSMVFAFYS